MTQSSLGDKVRGEGNGLDHLDCSHTNANPTTMLEKLVAIVLGIKVFVH